MAEEAFFEIRLPQFEGPFDLLLFFIERDELDIHDIPIARITDDFLGYLRQMSQMNIELASEFILVAATLMRIKARMLLPRFDAGTAENEVDTREELVRRLIEYKKFKLLCEELRPMEDARFKMERRGNIRLDLESVEQVAQPGEELSELTLYRLMQVYERLNRRYLNRTETVTHTVVQYPYTIDAQKQMVSRLLEINNRLGFDGLVQQSENKVHFVYSFLALLEMLQQQLVEIQVGLGYNNFWITAKPST